MTRAISSFANKVYQSLPTIRIDTPPNMLRKTALLAIPVLMLYGAQHAKFAEAGPLAYAGCLAGCAAMGPFAVACWPACLPILALPTP